MRSNLSSVRIAGRCDEQTGAIMIMRDGPLSINELRTITGNGAYPINIVTFIPLSELISGDIDWLNDTVSEQITGSIVGWVDISYRAYHQATASVDEVALLVTALLDENGVNLE